MKQQLKDLALMIALVAWYFASAYFAVAALYPPWALAAGILAGMLAMVLFVFMALMTDRETWFVVGWLAIIPTSCIAAGIIWWVLRWLDLWVIR